MSRMKTATSAVLHPAASMIVSIWVISAWPRGRSRTRWFGISAPSEASPKSDDDIAREDRWSLTARDRCFYISGHLGMPIAAATASPSMPINGPMIFACPIEHRFLCEACGKRGADVRPDFNWHKQPNAMMGY